jgi:hypothetical protein
MTGMDRHCRIVGASLAGERPVDEQAYASVTVLAERLERLKQSSGLFAGIEFSGPAETLRRHAEALVVR